jgi:hypothetical protein
VGTELGTVPWFKSGGGVLGERDLLFCLRERRWRSLGEARGGDPEEPSFLSTAMVAGRWQMGKWKENKKWKKGGANAFYVYLYVEKDGHAHKTQTRSKSGLNWSLVDPREGVHQTWAQNTNLGSGGPLFVWLARVIGTPAWLRPLSLSLSVCYNPKYILLKTLTLLLSTYLHLYPLVSHYFISLSDPTAYQYIWKKR